MFIKNLIVSAILLSTLSACAQEDPIAQKQQNNKYYSHTDTKPIKVSNAEWKKIISPGEYSVGREEATERAYTGEYHDNHASGTYYCGICGNLLFTSQTKFESGTGWPSYYQPAAGTSVREKTDADGSRTEVECARCGSHLGHVFHDGPRPTGLRYCMNSAVLDFVAQKK